MCEAYDCLMLLHVFCRFQYRAAGVATIHQECERSIQADVADISRFVDSWLIVQPFEIHKALTSMRRNGKVAYAEGGESLEEMRALRRVDAIAVEGGFDNGACHADMRPTDGDAQRRIATAPAARADEDVA